MLEIRQATEADLNMLTEWTQRLHEHEDDNQLEPHPDFSDNLKNWLSQEINNTNSLFLIAEENNNPVGFIGATCMINDNGLIADPLKGIIQLLWVEEPARKKATAVKLLEQIEKCFQQLGVKYIECSYTPGNELAINFWQKMDFKPCSLTARKFIA